MGLGKVAPAPVRSAPPEAEREASGLPARSPEEQLVPASKSRRSAVCSCRALIVLYPRRRSAGHRSAIALPPAFRILRRDWTSETTGPGSGAYFSSSAIFCASGVSIHARQSLSALPFAASLLSGWISSQVNDELG